MKRSILLLTLYALLFNFACTSGDTNNNSSTTSPVNNPTAAPSSDPQSETTNAPGTVADIPTGDEAPAAASDNMKVISWVQKLNIREQPNTKAKVVGSAKENESLTLTGNKSDQTETIELRGKTYTEPWIEVKTADGTTGWVFGGAVKKIGEDKGNALNTSTQFTLPHFGTFDLSTWKKMASRDDSESTELDVTTDVYQRGNQTLEITVSDMGEFHWDKNYKLLDANKKVLKERVAMITIDPHALTETVKDFNGGKLYTRRNEFKTYQKYDESKPILAKGDWTITSLSANKVGNTTTAKSASTTKMLGAMEGGACETHQERGAFDCACSFNEGDRYKGKMLFESNWNDKACVKVNGQMNALYPDWEERDYKADLKKLSESKDWITVRNDEVTYFGKPLADYKYEDAVEFLTDVILASGKDRSAIPIQTTTGGSAMETAKANADKAVAKAKDYMKKGGNDPLSIYKFDNRSYDVIVRVRKTTQFEGEANHYEGKITLLQNRGKEILETREVKGTCGC